MCYFVECGIGEEATTNTKHWVYIAISAQKIWSQTRRRLRIPQPHKYHARILWEVCLMKGLVGCLVSPTCLIIIHPCALPSKNEGQVNR